MPRQVFVFDNPERFVAGTVGQPGERTFFLQVRDRGRLVSVAMEKGQIAALAERVETLLGEVRRTAAVPTTADEDVAPLDVPVEEEFRVGALALGWDPEDELVVLEAQALSEAPAEPMSDESEGPDVLRVRITAEAARSFATRALRVVAAGRPPCPLCGLPLDPSGHICPRQNGHRRGADA
ncbi:MAG TPA: DUF3090 family protein [Frankiaceae bacterium]|nr:DUF3090 family protein [Frankiaceae bacterium]